MTGMLDALIYGTRDWFNEAGTLLPRRSAMQVIGGSIVDDPVNDRLVLTTTGAGGETVGPVITNNGTGTLNDVDTLSGGNRASEIRFTSATPITVTGFDATVGGHHVIVRAVLAPVTIANLNGGSASFNQVLTGTGTSVVVPAGGTALIGYDDVSQKWGLISGAGSPPAGDEGSIQYKTGTAFGGSLASLIDIASGAMVLAALAGVAPTTGDLRFPSGGSGGDGWTVMTNSDDDDVFAFYGYQDVGAPGQKVLGIGHDWDADGNGVDTALSHDTIYIWANNNISFATTTPTVTEGNYAGFKLAWWPGEVERALLIDGGTEAVNLALLGTRTTLVDPDDAFGGGYGVFYVGRAQTNPSTNPTLGVTLYVDAADDFLKYRQPDGDVIILSGTTTAGTDTQVIFNDAGALAGDAGMTFNKTSNVLSLTDAVAFGATPASVGSVRLPHTNNLIVLRNAAGTGNIVALSADSDNILIGGDTAGSNQAAVTQFLASTQLLFKKGVAVVQNLGLSSANDFTAYGDAPATSGNIRLSADNTIKYNVGGVVRPAFEFTSAALIIVGGSGASDCGGIINRITTGGTYYVQLAGNSHLTVDETYVRIGPGGVGAVLAFGATPATTGTVRFPQGAISKGRNNANTADLYLWQYGSGGNDSLYIGTDPAFTPASQVSNVQIYATTSGIVALGAGGQTYLYCASGNSITSYVPTLRFWEGVTSPVFSQNDISAPSSVGQPLVIQAQNATGATSTGGELRLTSGTGTTVAGNILLRTGGTTKLTITPTLITAAVALAFATTPATSGTIRLGEGNTIDFRDNANTANYTGIEFKTNCVNIGTTESFAAGPQVVGVRAYATTAGTVALGLGSATGFYVVGGQNQSWYPLVMNNAGIGNPSSAGAIRMEINTGIYSRNGANSANILLIGTTAANGVNVGDTTAAFCRLNGGSGDVSFSAGSGSFIGGDINATGVFQFTSTLSRFYGEVGGYLDAFCWNLLNVTVTGNVTLTAGQSESVIVHLNGTPGGAYDVVAPNREGAFYLVRNLSGQAATWKKSGGTGVALSGTIDRLYLVYHDGTDYKGTALAFL